MDMGTFSMIVWGGGAIFLMFKGAYHDQRLKRYVDRRYPEEGKVIRAHEWQMYPWSTQARTLRALIKKERVNDPELARLARKAKLSIIYCITWIIGVFFLDSFIISKYY